MLCFQLVALPPNGFKKSNKYKDVILLCLYFNTTMTSAFGREGEKSNKLTVVRTESGSLNALISIVSSFRQLQHKRSVNLNAYVG